MDDMPNAIDVVPEPSTIRTQLAERLREVSLLRRLLKISEEKDRQRKTPDASRGRTRGGAA